MATNNAINQIGVLPSFMAVQNADQASVTGDGSVYVPQFTNVVYNATSSFDGTSTFTAPLTGKYCFGVHFQFTNVAAGMTIGYCQLITTLATYNLFFLNPGTMRAANNILTIQNSIIVPMTATNTASLNIAFLNGAKAVTIQGATAAASRTPFFSGYMISGI